MSIHDEVYGTVWPVSGLMTGDVLR